MSKIVKGLLRTHAKASERYVDVIFTFDDDTELDTSVPIEYRRTGTDIKDTDVDAYIAKIHEALVPTKWSAWRGEQEVFWRDKSAARTTKSFFDVLARRFIWSCTVCTLPPNPNWARRIQDLKEFGYTIATNTNRYCPQCDKKTTQLVLLPIKRGGLTGYETWTPALRSRIIKVLAGFDEFEAKATRPEGLLPDHKFPEIRWDLQTKRDSLHELTDDEIKRDFQLLSNQRNQQKREVCRRCFQTGVRGVIYGIPFYYEGSSAWRTDIPKIGKAAEQGCVGCGWYDISMWRNELIKKLG